jgi:hypothetical protein
MYSIQEVSPVLVRAVQSVLAATSLAFGIHYLHRRFRPRPPGPLGYPLIGNVFDLQNSREPEKIADLGTKYGLWKVIVLYDLIYHLS